MRTLEKNNIKLWYVVPTAETDEVDGNGNYTGEKTFTYSTPVQIAIHIYPATGDVDEQMFGKAEKFDMIGISNSLDLASNGLLFLTQPSTNFDTTYEFSISEIFESLNTKRYGLKRRIK